MRETTMKFVLVVLGVMFCTLAGCTTKVVKCTGDTDNPQHHYLMGMKALEDGNLTVAREKFDRAIYCNEKFSKGYAGLGIIGGEKMIGQDDFRFRTIETELVDSLLKNAKKYADLPDEYFDYYIAQIRTQTAMKPKGWLTKAVDAYTEAMKLHVDERSLNYYQGPEAASYFIGLAYLEALEFNHARDSFAAVFNAKKDGKWHERADLCWKKTDRVVRAMSGVSVGDVGKKIAIKDSVTRADLAALLIDELKIDRLMAGRIPVSEESIIPKVEFVPADIVDQPFRNEVLSLLKWKVRGMESKFDQQTQAYLFKPTDAVSRGELAFVLEDVLLKIIGNEKIAIAYFNLDVSPFTDVRASSPVFNAVITVTTRGILEGDMNGKFRPNDPVNGADALLSIRMLHQKLTVY